MKFLVLFVALVLAIIFFCTGVRIIIHLSHIFELVCIVVVVLVLFFWCVNKIR